MINKPISRRKFLKDTLAATAALAISPSLSAAEKSESAFDAKGLPTRILGQTGVKVPLTGVGTGSRFCAVKEEDKALQMLTYALDHGLYYWDTAHSYGNDEVISEKRLGKIVKHRRREIFLATKVEAREPDEAKRYIEESLSRLQTDYVNLLQIHSVESVEDVEIITKKGGLLDVVREMKEQGVARHIGFTGHRSAEAMAMAARNYDFDTMLIALNHYHEEVENDEKQDFENKAVPVAAEKGLGVIAMKVIRPRETVKSVTPDELVRYALSLKNVNAAVISVDDLKFVKANIAILQDFKPLDKKKMDKIRMALAPFYRHEGLEWMQPHYRDGLLA
ncbi:MAG: aldo/keto reductase [Planctomycetota bacterium]|jgi:aryl-alcohol dehydrogenase-like predicted oxidoreductase